MPSLIRLLFFSVLFCLSLCGCSSRIIKPDMTLLAPRLAAPSQPEQSKVSYSIIGAGTKDSERVDNAFKKAFAGHGVSLVTPAPATPHIVVYSLPAEQPGPGASLPFAMKLVSFLALLPVCEDLTYPVELHLIGKGVTRSSSYRDQYIVKQCQWLPTIFTSGEEIGRLKDEALRAVFDKAAATIISGL